MMYQSIRLNENIDHMIEVEAGRALHTPAVRKQRENADCMVGKRQAEPRGYLQCGIKAGGHHWLGQLTSIGQRT